MEIIVPKDEQEWLALRRADITSTDIAALFGISPYMTEFELWHRKKSSLSVSIDINERMKWGTRLQDSIAAGIAEDNDWHIRRMAEYIRDPNYKIGASFDFAIEGTESEAAPVETSKYGLLEIKNVDALQLRDNWVIDGNNVEAPPHIELQVQHQLLVSGRAFAYIGALVGGNKVVLIRREPDHGVFAAIRSKVGQFWQSVESDAEPRPEFERDADFIARLCGYAEPGRVLHADGNSDLAELVRTYREHAVAERDAESKKAGVKAQILMAIGHAEKVLGDGYTISCGIIPEAEIEAYTRAAYRSFRCNFKKEKP